MNECDKLDIGLETTIMVQCDKYDTHQKININMLVQIKLKFIFHKHEHKDQLYKYQKIIIVTIQKQYICEI